MTVSHSLSPPRPVMTVQGPVSHDRLGITDAHNHVWIDRVAGADPDGPFLNQFDPILMDLTAYCNEGGSTLLDCQPSGCGRNGNRLSSLSIASGINLIACTGFHLKKYYPQDHWLWQSGARKICDFICSELDQGLTETLKNPSPVKAGFIKIALESTWVGCPHAALEGTASASLESNGLIMVHTEKGALAEKICVYFMDLGLLPHQLMLCHMDKRPDLGLHKELARLGILLEYDTFYRPKYNPSTKLWPLVEKMVSAGYSNRIAFATDMAGPQHYQDSGSVLGLASLPGEIRDQLIRRDFPAEVQMQMLGGNIARRLAGID